MTKPELANLIDRYLKGDATAAEEALVQYWLVKESGKAAASGIANASGIDGASDIDGTSGIDAAKTEEEDYARRHAEMWAVVSAAINRKQARLWPRIIGIAAAVATITLGVWLYYASNLNGRHPDSSLSSRANAKDLNDIAPGKNTATIKIGNGEAITLSDKQTGVIVNNNQVTYNDGSTVLSSRAPSLSSRANAKDLTVSTPRGGTYQITLPDGTKVWLNAASVLTYTMPLNERGGTRRVELNGEAYFEVFKNKNQPFVVTTKNLTTTVLGTHFNISAYDDDKNTKATLLEGSVRVSSSRAPSLSSRAQAKDLDPSEVGMTNGKGGEGEGVTLKPSQQATITDNKSIQVKTVPTEETIAWKNGYFRFNDENITSIMAKLSRWYNIDVVFETTPTTEGFNGKISRYKNISQVLKMLEETNAVHFKVQGQKVTVLK